MDMGECWGGVILKTVGTNSCPAGFHLKATPSRYPVDYISHQYKDLVIHCSDGVFQTMASLLSATSSFIRNLITENQTGFPGHIHEISLPDATVEQMEVLVQFLVTGSLPAAGPARIRHLRWIVATLSIDIFNMDNVTFQKIPGNKRKSGSVTETSSEPPLSPRKRMRDKSPDSDSGLGGDRGPGPESGLEGDKRPGLEGDRRRVPGSGLEGDKRPGLEGDRRLIPDFIEESGQSQTKRDTVSDIESIDTSSIDTSSIGTSSIDTSSIDTSSTFVGQGKKFKYIRNPQPTSETGAFRYRRHKRMGKRSVATKSTCQSISTWRHVLRRDEPDESSEAASDTSDDEGEENRSSKFSPLSPACRDLPPVTVDYNRKEMKCYQIRDVRVNLNRTKCPELVAMMQKINSQKDLSDDKLSCTICNRSKKFNSKTALKYHECQHAIKAYCYVCERFFPVGSHDQHSGQLPPQQPGSGVGGASDKPITGIGAETYKQTNGIGEETNMILNGIALDTDNMAAIAADSAVDTTEDSGPGDSESDEFESEYEASDSDVLDDSNSLEVSTLACPNCQKAFVYRKAFDRHVGQCGSNKKVRNQDKGYDEASTRPSIDEREEIEVERTGEKEEKGDDSVLLLASSGDRERPEENLATGIGTAMDNPELSDIERNVQ